MYPFHNNNTFFPSMNVFSSLQKFQLVPSINLNSRSLNIQAPLRSNPTIRLKKNSTARSAYRRNQELPGKTRWFNRTRLGIGFRKHFAVEFNITTHHYIIGFYTIGTVRSETTILLTLFPLVVSVSRPTFLRWIFFTEGTKKKDYLPSRHYGFYGNK